MVRLEVRLFALRRLLLRSFQFQDGAIRGIKATLEQVACFSFPLQDGGTIGGY